LLKYIKIREGLSPFFYGDYVLKTKDLLGLREVDAQDIHSILEQAFAFKELFTRPVKQVQALRGKTIVNLFFEPSTRTRNSFDRAIKTLGATSINIAVAQSSVKKGETIIDTVKNIEAMGIDALIVRHKNAGVPRMIADNVSVPVINAGDGFHEHPTQALLDMFTMQEKKGDLKGKKITIIGDVLHSRVARSNIWGLNKMGAKVTICGPSSLIPADIAQMGCKVENNLEKAIAQADFLNILRVQFERQNAGFFPTTREYRTFFGITQERLERAKDDVVILHPGPMNRGIEIDSEVADGEHNVILEQVLNGVAVRMAVLYLLITGGEL
jgi:aspartate carbamoyltransferase catalytic subunit